jgi:hypothetical protein
VLRLFEVFNNFIRNDVCTWLQGGGGLFSFPKCDIGE